MFLDQIKSIFKSKNLCDVIAGPGNGKTTALLAKLTILSKKSPIEMVG